MEFVPLDIIRCIFQNLSIKDIKSFRLVSKQCCDIGNALVYSFSGPINEIKSSWKLPNIKTIALSFEKEENRFFRIKQRELDLVEFYGRLPSYNVIAQIIKGIKIKKLKLKSPKYKIKHEIRFTLDSIECLDAICFIEFDCGFIPSSLYSLRIQTSQDFDFDNLKSATKLTSLCIKLDSHLTLAKTTVLSTLTNLKQLALIGETSSGASINFDLSSKTLEKLIKLEELKLKKVHVLFNAFQGLSTVTKLELYRNEPPHIHDWFSNLKHLNLTTNIDLNTYHSDLTNLVNLNYLRLNMDVCFGEFETFTNLRDLIIDARWMTSGSLRTIATLTNLTKLHIGRAGPANAAYVGIALPNLRDYKFEVKIENPDVDDWDFRQLLLLTQICSLTIHGRLSEVQTEAMTQLTNLTYIETII